MATSKDTLSNLLIFGASGDLAMRKLYPALYRLVCEHELELGKIVGVTREKLDHEQMLERVKRSLEANLPSIELSDVLWKVFSTRLIFIQANVNQPESFDEIACILDRPISDLVVYLATESWLYGEICQQLARCNLVDAATRVVLEKPIGDNLASSKKIHRAVGEVFSEQQIYRIDHYLGKETVQNLMAIRFANTLFEPLWNRHAIDHVQITVAESVGVEGRWSYYDGAGALRDMVQNHLLQLLCLVAMEPPISLAANAVREEKLKVLRSLKPLTHQDVSQMSVRAQYAPGDIDSQPAQGYCQEPGGKVSKTETFVALRAEVDSWRWAGVPFYLRTGKRLPIRYSEIVIQFKSVPYSLFGTPLESNLVANALIIRLQPEESIQLVMMNKVPGLEEQMRLGAVPLNLSLSEAFHQPQTALAHERLLLDVFRKNQTLFLHAEEVEAAWGWIDSIQEGWQVADCPLRYYSAGSWGPEEAFELIKRDGRYWHD